MSVEVFLVVLFAAALHAGWNAVVKGARDKLSTTILVASAAGAIGVVVLPFLPQPAPASHPWLIASVCFQIAYFVLVAQTYGRADMSLVYPLMRGTAPLVVALIGAAATGERPSPLAWAGIATISLGIGATALIGRRHGDRHGIAFALLTAVTIAGYTLLDGIGVRLSGAPAAYTLWSSVGTAPPLILWALTRRRAAFLAAVRAIGGLALFGGAATVVSYGLALWAMTRAPVATVAALRETSIVFGVTIAVLAFGERPSRARLLSVAAVLCGAAMLRAG